MIMTYGKYGAPSQIFLTSDAPKAQHCNKRRCITLETASATSRIVGKEPRSYELPVELLLTARAVTSRILKYFTGEREFFSTARGGSCDCNTAHVYFTQRVCAVDGAWTHGSSRVGASRIFYNSACCCRIACPLSPLSVMLL